MTKCETCKKEFSGVKVLPTKDKIYEHPIKICHECEVKAEQSKKSEQAALTLLADEEFCKRFTLEINGILPLGVYLNISQYKQTIQKAAGIEVKI